MKKNMLKGFILLLGVLSVTACGKKNEGDSNLLGGEINSKDLKSKKDTIIDGKEVTEYEMNDGSKVAVPKDFDKDALKVE